MNLKQSIEHCRAINKRFATNYYLATRFFPRSIREATWVLYAFVRVPDEFVDTDHSRDLSVAREKLEKWRSDWHTACEKNTTDDPVLFANLWLFEKYKIPHEYADAFLDAMLQDTQKKRYANFTELDDYMYGSAQVVGLMMSHIIGESRGNEHATLHPDTIKYAKALGDAFQLTNFLRDIREDYELRDRIYMPLDELAQFGLSEDDIKNHTTDERWQKFMQFQIDRAREYYRQADLGIPLLDKKGQRAVRIARHLYASILDRIEENKYDIYAKRASTSWWGKIKIVIRHFFERF